MQWALCCFPLVGVAIGAALWLWLCLAQLLSLGPALRGAVSLLLPVALSGGIHMDGFCDTVDALASHQPRERKLEILKDSRIGAFAVFSCVLYLLLFFAAWCEIEPTGRQVVVLALSPILARSLSALSAVTTPNARGNGMLAAFTAPMDLTKARCVLSVWSILSAGGMLAVHPLAGAAAVAAAGLAFLGCRRMALRQFGGLTGDLAGFFLQICECAMVLAIALTQR